MQKHVAGRSVCPVACALDLIGDKWTLLVIRDLLLGKAHFKEFMQSPERIATNVLAERLTRLSEGGMVERYPSDVFPGREAYRLTSKGASLKPLLEHMAAWGLKHIEGTSVRLKAYSRPPAKTVTMGSVARSVALKPRRHHFF